jgi:hypothetical protein
MDTKETEGVCGRVRLNVIYDVVSSHVRFPWSLFLVVSGARNY